MGNRIPLTALVVIVIVGTAATAATARSFRSSHITQRATYTSIEVSGAFGTGRCPLTLEGAFHEYVTLKTASLIGFMERINLGACTVGTMRVLTETLPWHIQYVGFQGTLPNITRILTKIVGFAISIREPFGLVCLFRSSATEPVSSNYTREAGGVLTELQLGGEIRTGSECFGVRATLRSVPSTFESGIRAAITVTLI
jgi:hypothetical protein